MSFSVSDLDSSSTFYDQVLGALGYRRVFSGPTSAGWGSIDGRERFAIKKRVEEVTSPSPGFHLAFYAQTMDQIGEAYRKALELGGKDNRALGPRPHYGEGYYAAFVVDPDGYEIEFKLGT